MKSICLKLAQLCWLWEPRSRYQTILLKRNCHKLHS